MIRTFCLLLLFVTGAVAVENGRLTLRPADLTPGKSLSLNGQWLYRPGYEIQAGERPELSVANGSVRVPVPQLLNRIQWWLDDSEDYKRSETNRLAKLGFDTDRAEDGWYYLRL